MTKAKMLGAMIILSAAVATPGFAQDAGKRGQANRRSLELQSNPAGAYNQLNEPFQVASRKRDRWDPANPNVIDKDPSVTGGEDLTRRPNN